jgi:hypothetical protein
MRVPGERMRVPGGSAAQEAASGALRRRRGRCSLVCQRARGELARMVIKNDIDRLTDAKVLCKMEIYETPCRGSIQSAVACIRRVACIHI